MKRIIYILTVILLVWFISCKCNKTPVHKTMDKGTEKLLMNPHGIKIDSIFIVDTTMIVRNEPKIDSFSIQFQLNRIDSNIKYFKLAQEYGFKGKDMEILYYQTGDDKYRIKGNRYYSLSNKYAKECNKYSGKNTQQK